MLDTIKKWTSGPKEEAKLEEPKGIFVDPVSIVTHGNDEWRSFRIPNHESTIFMVQAINVADIEFHGTVGKKILGIDYLNPSDLECESTKQLGLWGSDYEDLIEIRPEVYQEELKYKNEYKIKAKIKKSGRIEPSQIDDDLLELMDN